MTYTVSSEWVADVVIKDWAKRGFTARKELVSGKWVVSA